MHSDRSPSPGLDAFWEQADQEGSEQHPLERELLHRMDALERYRAMIYEAQASGHDEMVEVLSTQANRQAQLVRRLSAALRQLR